MLDLFAVGAAIENNKIEPFTNNENKLSMHKIILIAIGLIICFGTSYLAFNCNLNEKPATRALYTIFAFLFSGIYLIYYFIYHVILGKKCGSGKDISNIVTNMKKRKGRR
jgi:quinol-cytochrome oxidoreductase complex cytochrome b subunit